MSLLAEIFASERFDLAAQVEGLRRELAILRPAKPKRGGGSLLLSKREAAKRLGVDRNKGLAALIESGQLHVVKRNGADAVPVGEVERLASEGYDTSARSSRPRRHGVNRKLPAPVSTWKLKL